MPDQKKLVIAISQEEHGKLKALAALKGITIKEAILNALDKTYPDWRQKQEK